MNYVQELDEAWRELDAGTFVEDGRPLERSASLRLSLSLKLSLMAHAALAQ